MKYPRLSIRVSQELKDACDKAGPEAIRSALSVLLSDNTNVVRQDTPKVSDKLPLSDKEPAKVVGQLSDNVKLSDKVPSWKAKLDQDRERLASVKAAKDKLRAAAEADSFHGK